MVFILQEASTGILPIDEIRSYFWPLDLLNKFGSCFLVYKNIYHAGKRLCES